MVTKNIVHVTDSAKNENDINQGHKSNLKNWNHEIPNLPYTNPYMLAII